MRAGERERESTAVCTDAACENTPACTSLRGGVVSRPSGVSVWACDTAERERERERIRTG